MKGQLDLLYGTGKNSFVIKGGESASIIVSEDEKISQKDIGKYFYYDLKKVQIGSSEFLLAHNLVEI